MIQQLPVSSNSNLSFYIVFDLVLVEPIQLLPFNKK